MISKTQDVIPKLCEIVQKSHMKVLWDWILKMAVATPELFWKVHWKHSPAERSSKSMIAEFSPVVVIFSNLASVNLIIPFQFILIVDLRVFVISVKVQFSKMTSVVREGFWWTIASISMLAECRFENSEFRIFMGEER